MIRFGEIFPAVEKIATGITRLEAAYNILMNPTHIGGVDADSSYAQKVKNGEVPINKDLMDSVTSMTSEEYAVYLQNNITVRSDSKRVDFISDMTKRVSVNDQEGITQIAEVLNVSPDELLNNPDPALFYKFLSNLIIISLLTCPNNEVNGSRIKKRNKRKSDSSFVLSNTLSQKKFNEVFREVGSKNVGHAQKLSKLRIYALRFDGMKFEYTALLSYLAESLGSFVFSRQMMEDKKSSPYTISSDAINELEYVKGDERDFKGMMTYVFLENALGAPKIFNSVEDISMAGKRDLVDGVYLLQDGDDFQFVFGTSDIHSDLKSALYSVFGKASRIEDLSEDLINNLNTPFLNKYLDVAGVNKIKDILIPQKPGSKKRWCPSYGIFIGYTVCYDPDEVNTSGYESVWEKQLKRDIEDLSPFFEELLNRSGLAGRNFYLYVLPFNRDEDASRIGKAFIRGKKKLDPIPFTGCGEQGVI